MARALQGMASMGKVHIPNCEWGDRLVEQLVSFPAGKHDDAVDALGLFAMAIESAHPAIERSTPSKKDLDLWGNHRQSGDSWKTV